MKKIYERPELELSVFSVSDIITTSTTGPIGGGGGADIVTPEDEF